MPSRALIVCEPPPDGEGEGEGAAGKGVREPAPERVAAEFIEEEETGRDGLDAEFNGVLSGMDRLIKGLDRLRSLTIALLVLSVVFFIAAAAVVVKLFFFRP